MTARKVISYREYALLVSIVAVFVAAAAIFFGDDLKGLFGPNDAPLENITQAPLHEGSQF